MAISELLKKRLSRDREMTTITLRIPVDVVDSMKAIAPKKGYSGYQALLKTYISMGLRTDEAEFVFSKSARLIEALKKRGAIRRAELGEVPPSHLRSHRIRRNRVAFRPTSYASPAYCAGDNLLVDFRIRFCGRRARRHAKAARSRVGTRRDFR